MAQCEIPDSKLAETLLEEQLRKFGKGTWLESHKANQERSAQNEVQAKSASDWDWECSEYFITVVCQVDSQSGDLTNCVITDIRCISYELVYNGSGGGGGGGGGFPGDDPGECDPMGTEPCFEDGGGGSIPPPEPDPCDEPNPPAWCQPGNKCETGDATIDNTGVQETFEDQWGKSNADATDQSDRLEQGGWITEDPISGELGFTEFPSEWTRQPCRIQLPEIITVPNNTVGILHTHPFQLGEKMYSCANLSQTMYQQFQQQFGSVVKTYEGNPSHGDVSLIEQINDASPQTIKAYLIDENGITEYDENSDPNDINTSNRHERCGF